MVGQYGEIRTRPQTGLHLYRLPVRPERGQGQTLSGALADRNHKDTRPAGQTHLYGPATDVSHRATDSHRKVSPPRSTPYEADILALRKQWYGTRFTKKGDPHPQVTPPPSKVWLQEDDVLQGQPLHPLKHALQIFTDASKEGCSPHVGKHTTRGTWFLPESKLHKLFGAKGSLSGPKKVPGLLLEQQHSGLPI